MAGLVNTSKRHRFPHFRWESIICLSLFFLVSACGSSPRQQVEQVLSQREQALAGKDLGAYMELVSRQYDDNGKTYQDIQIKTEQNFAAFSKIEISSDKRGVYLEGKQAVVVQEYVLSFWVASERQSIKGKERLVLQEEKDGWKIIKGL